ncbi:MAG: hypothetical protein ACKO85_08260, partial [Isosphaeraceae bacterium]
SARARTKPEGRLLIVRELDLGTLPAGGSMEAVLSLKNPSPETAYAARKLIISSPGIAVEPAEFTIAPGATLPLTFQITPDATRNPGHATCDISGLTDTGDLLFRTTLSLKVK